MRHTLKRKNSFGLTLIELVIVISSLAVISLAVFSTFNNGMKIWQKVNKPLQGEDLGIFLDKFSHDLRNTFNFAVLQFSGSKNRISFPTVVESKELGIKTVGQVIYSFAQGSKTAIRVKRDYSQVYNDKKGPDEFVLANVNSMGFQYYVFDKENGMHVWENEYLKKGLPLAVRIDLEVDNGVKTDKVSKTISIPVSR